MHRLESSPIPGFSNSDLLTDIFSELLDPIIIIGRDRQIIFKSHSFEDIIGKPLDDNKLSCDLLILPSITGCCIEAIDNYPAETRSGIWNLKQHGGGIVPVLATWCPVNVGSQLSLLAIQCTPIQPSASPVSLSFFRGIRQSSEDEDIYMQRTADYLHQTFNCGVVAWFDLTDGAKLVHSIGLGASEIEALKDIVAEPHCQAQDLLVADQHGCHVFHLFANCDAGKNVGLVIGKMKNDISNGLIDSLTATVASTLRPDSADEHAFESDTDFQSTFEVMTPAEADILEKLLLGMTDKEIAVTREVSPYTVKNQVKRVLKKAGAQRRIELIRRFSPSRARSDQTI